MLEEEEVKDIKSSVVRTWYFPSISTFLSRGTFFMAISYGSHVLISQLQEYQLVQNPVMLTDCVAPILFQHVLESEGVPFKIVDIYVSSRTMTFSYS